MVSDCLIYKREEVVIMQELSYEERCEKVAMMWLDTFNNGNGCMSDDKAIKLYETLEEYGVDILDFWKCIDKHTYSK